MVLSVLLAGCHTTSPPPDADAGTLDSGRPDDADVSHDSEVPDDAVTPRAAGLRLRLRVRTEGSVVEGPGEVDVPQGRLVRFDLGVKDLAFEGDRPMAPGLHDVGTLSFVAEPRSVTVSPAAPGLYSGVILSLAPHGGDEALDVEIERAGDPYRLHTRDELSFELRCADGGFELGVSERLEIPLYANVDEFGDDLLDQPADQLADALMDSLSLACDEARAY